MPSIYTLIPYRNRGLYQLPVPSLLGPADVGGIGGRGGVAGIALPDDTGDDWLLWWGLPLGLWLLGVAGFPGDPR